MKNVKFAKFNEIVSTDVGFSIDGKSNECKYVNIMGQKNKDGTFDFILGEINSTFTLAPDLLVIVKKIQKVGLDFHILMKNKLLKFQTQSAKINLQSFSPILKLLSSNNSLSY